MPTPIHAIHYPIAIEHGGGRLQQSTDYEIYINQLIRQVLLTSPGERINRPTFGAGVRRLVFAPIGASTASLTQTVIFQALNQWLGRLIKVDDVKTEAQGEQLNVTIVYTIIARNEQHFLNLEVTL